MNYYQVETVKDSRFIRAEGYDVMGKTLDFYVGKIGVDKKDVVRFSYHNLVSIEQISYEAYNRLIPREPRRSF